MILILFTAVLIITMVFFIKEKPNRRNVEMQRRTKLIGAMCIIGYVWSLVGLALIISPAIKKFGIFYPALFGICVSLKFISYVGVWHMKKWGLEFMLFAYGFEICIGITLDYVSITNIVIGALSLITFIPYYRKMGVNL